MIRLTPPQCVQNVSKFICKPTKSTIFIYLFILNLLSNLVYLKYNNEAITIIGIITISTFISYIESAIYTSIKIICLRKLYISIIILLHNILLIIEYFLLLKFHLIISQELIDIIADTNKAESINFLETYLNFSTISLYIILIFIVNFVFILISKLLKNTKYQGVSILLVIIGMTFVTYCIYGFARYHNGQGIPQMSSISRTGYAIYLTKQKINENKLLIETCNKVKATQNIKIKPSIVIIIGESYSVYHSSLYGYNKPTNPLLKHEEKKGNLFLFNNAVTIYPATTATMYAVFSLDSLGVNFTDKPLFPICFKKTGYKVKMYDNQYFVNQGLSFMCDNDVSKTLFDYRNIKEYKYDEDLVKSITVNKNPTLYIIHLKGQHYIYKTRFPIQFTKFKAKDYSFKYTEEQRQIMADYDNATLYNDNVVNSIFDKFKNKYCCIFYFSDHGEEVYELRDYMGHGNAEDSPNPNYQLRVPLMVWLSPSFKQANSNIVNELYRAKKYPISTDDIGHSILDIAGIRNKDFKPNLSFINCKFNKKRHRIVMSSVDYDKSIINKR